MRNIVLVTLDSVRANHCSFMGYQRKTTPNLDKMAENGVYFERAYSPSPRTLTSISSIFLGSLIKEYVNCHSMESLRRNVMLNLNLRKTLAEILREKGYTTAAFNPNAFASRYFGLDKGFDHFEDFLFEEDRFAKLFRGGKLIEIFRNFSNLFRRREVFLTWDRYYSKIIKWVKSSNKPFFLWIFMLDTHFPYVTPWNEIRWTNIFEMYYWNFRLYTYIDKRSHPSKKEISKMVDVYDSAIHYADKFFGKITQDLKTLDPVYIVTSDHGEAFFEKGYFGHYFPYLNDENIHVPLVIHNLDEMDKVFSRPTSLVDLSKLIVAISMSKRDESIDLDKIFGKKPILAKGIGYRRGIRRYCVISKDWRYMQTIKNGKSIENLLDTKTNSVVNLPKVASTLRRYVEQEIEFEKQRKRTIRANNKRHPDQKEEIRKKLKSLGYLD